MRADFPNQDPLAGVSNRDYRPAGPGCDDCRRGGRCEYTGLQEEPQTDNDTAFLQNLWWRSLYLLFGKARALGMVTAVRNEFGRRSNCRLANQTIDQLMWNGGGAACYTYAGMFGAIALFSAVGIYWCCLLRDQRTRAIGVRRALGSRREMSWACHGQGIQRPSSCAVGSVGAWR